MTENKREVSSAPEQIDDEAVDGVVGGGMYSNTTPTLTSLSSSWLRVNGVKDEQVDEYSQPVDSPDAQTKPSYPTIKL